MNYTEAMEQLISLSRFGINLGLKRITALLEQMENPQNALQFVHVAGTNGKGSISTMLSNMLIHSGYQTGLFISPYVLCFRERMQIGGEMISEEEFADCAAFVYDCATQLPSELESPTQFEMETAIAFEWYKRRKCDIVCLEVGLGGRFDSTNVIQMPLLQIITSISLDHTAILGDTIEKIAYEKAGIIKGGTTVLYPIQQEPVRQVVKEQCQETNSHLIEPDLTKLDISNHHWRKSTFTYEGKEYQKSLPGTVQIYNGITAITAAQQLQKQGFCLSESDIKFGIEHTYFPARMEVLSEKPLVILDGSHNPDGARALEQTLMDLFEQPLTIIMGVLQDKDDSSILEIVGKYAQRIVTVTPNNPRAMQADELAKKAKTVCDNVCAYEDIQSAVEDTLKGLSSGDVLIVCGSLYLASEARPVLLEKLS